jgi:hypothetical protein
MSGTMSTIAVGVFSDRRQAQQAVADLKQAGFLDEKIGVAAKGHDDANGTTADKKGTYVGEGATVGVAAGAGVGVAAGAGVGALWALGIVAGFLPAVGPVVAGGIFASILASAAGGAAIAGVAGALIGLGIPEEDAHYYEGEFRSGRAIVTVQADGRYEEAWTILSRNGAFSRSAAPAAS